MNGSSPPERGLKAITYLAVLLGVIHAILGIILVGTLSPRNMVVGLILLVPALLLFPVAIGLRRQQPWAELFGVGAFGAILLGHLSLFVVGSPTPLFLLLTAVVINFGLYIFFFLEPFENVNIDFP